MTAHANEFVTGPPAEVETTTGLVLRRCDYCPGAYVMEADWAAHVQHHSRGSELAGAVRKLEQATRALAADIHSGRIT